MGWRLKKSAGVGGRKVLVIRDAGCTVRRDVRIGRIICWIQVRALILIESCVDALPNWSRIDTGLGSWSNFLTGIHWRTLGTIVASRQALSYPVCVAVCAWTTEAVEVAWCR